MAATTTSTHETEVAILARVFGGEDGPFPPELARFILDLDFSGQDKTRMHDLAVRNQDDALSPTEKEELLAFARAGTLLAILQSRARRALGVKPPKPTTS
jgi:hypothetical protein